MNLTILPSLKQSAAVSVAVQLWTSENMKAVNNRPFHRIIKTEELRDTEVFKSAAEKLSTLMEVGFIPKKIEPLLKSALQAVAKEFNWLVCKYRHLWFRYINKLQWTSTGNVDKGSLTRLIVNNEEVELMYRYELACEFCLIEDIPDLYQQLVENPGGKRFVEYICCKNSTKSLLVYWTKYYTNLEVPLASCTLDGAVRTGNLEAVQYFCNKLMSEGTGIPHLVDKALLAGRLNCMETFCYLMNHMTDLQQEEVVGGLPQTFVLNFLDWPWQDLFLENFRLVFNESSFAQMVLVRIIENMTTIDFPTYRKIFHEIWYMTSSQMKRMILELGSHFKYYSFSAILVNLLMLGDTETADMVIASTACDAILVQCQCYSFLNDSNKFLSLVKQCQDCKHRINKDVKRLLKQITVSLCIEFFKADKWSFIELCLLNHLEFEELFKFKQRFVLSVDDDLIRYYIQDDIDLLEKINCWLFGGYNGKFSFKWKFIKTSGKDFCIDHIRKNEWQMLEQFLVWTCFSEDQVEELKKEVVFSKDGLNTCIHLALKTFDDNDDIQSSQLLRFIRWSLLDKEWFVQWQSEFKKLCQDYFRDSEKETEMILSVVNSAINVNVH